MQHAVKTKNESRKNFILLLRHKVFNRGLQYVAIIGCLQLAACAVKPFLSLETESSGRLSEETITRHASSGRLEFTEAQVITGNDAAFHSKLDMVQKAKASIDAMYYIYKDDYSSSVLSEALIAAARRGVRVRILLDYHTNYRELDLFTKMEKQANGGSGSLEIRFYNRPTRNIVMDAVYMTMGCGKTIEERQKENCSAAKFAEIEKRFAAENIDGRPAAELGISNLLIGNSGMFLSGIYSKLPPLMALAVLRGQDIDLKKFAEAPPTATPQDKENLKKVGQIYFNSRTGDPFSRLVSKLQLAVLFQLYGEALNPIYDTFTEYLPAERKGAGEAARDWEYITDFLHHKLLLVDNASLQLGGRNIEDSYHMRPNKMVEKYIFLDTDARAVVKSGGDAIGRAFEKLWNFRRMVASTSEVRQHAPNEFSANFAAFEEAEKICTAVAQKEAQIQCLDREFGKRALTLTEREERRFNEMRRNAERYWKEYQYARAADPSQSFAVDGSALMVYLENVPFYGGPADPPNRRAYGAKNGEEAYYGKRIHALWVAGLEQTCRSATAANPQRVILHQAYFFLPSNLIRQFGRMINGELDCRYVTVTVLTNSIETTDLNVVNLLARHSIKAFAEHYQTQRDRDRGARFEYFEYKKFDQQARISLHTKVSIFGDDFYVGSANGDVRSYMMDTNNGLWLRGASKFMDQYVKYLNGLMADLKKTLNMTHYFATTGRDQILSEDRKTFQAILKQYRVERWMDAGEQKKAEALFVRTLDNVYAMTKAILAGGREGRAVEAEFDRMFKPI